MTKAHTWVLKTSHTSFVPQTSKGSQVVAPICSMFFSVHLHPPFLAEYLMPAGVPVQNIVGPSSPVYAVQVQCFKMLFLVKEPKQYLHAATVSSKGPRVTPESIVAFVLVMLALFSRTAIEEVARAKVTKRPTRAIALCAGWAGGVPGLL